MSFWWQQFPTRWVREQEALTATGWQWRADETHADVGVLGVVVDYPVPAEYACVVQRRDDPENGDGDCAVVRLQVDYPAAYPFFPPRVRDVENRLRLARHREPVAGTLCLTGPADWATPMTAAAHLATQMPRMLATATSSAPPPDGWEVRAAESAGHLVPDAVGARVLVDSSWDIATTTGQGVLVVGFTGDLDGDLGVGVVKLLGTDYDLLETFPDRLTRQFPLSVPGRWLRWDNPPFQESAEALWNEAESRLAQERTAAGDVPGRAASAGVEVIGLLVPSEVAYRQPGEEWFLLVRRHDDRDHGGARYELRHCAWAGPRDVVARTPATAGLADRAVLVVGTGALGGTVAMELARAGLGALDLVDGDLCDPATACRQHAPAVFAGFTKTSVLGQLLAEANPHVNVRAHCVRLGTVHIPEPGQPDAHHALAHLIGHADLVVDAAADPGVSRYLAALAAAREKPLLHASATAGGYGGLVAVLAPDGSACWWCMLYHRADHTLPLPPAAAGDTGTVVPVGCSEPTFAGTGADLTSIASHAARVAIDRLSAATTAGGMRGNVYVAALRDHRGRPIPVRWRTRTLTVHPDCPMHTLHHRTHTHQQPTDGPVAATAQPDQAGTVPTTAGAPTRNAATA